jgi:putative transposase
MTRTRYRIYETEHPYFLTCTVVPWLPAFTHPEADEGTGLSADCSSY